MSVPIILSGYAPALGADITNVSASLTLSADSNENGYVEMLIDSELITGDKSGTTVSNLTRAAERWNGTATAASHTKGATVYFVLARQQALASFATKIDEAIGADFAAASITFPLHGSAFPTTGGTLRISYQLRSTSVTNGQDFLQVQFNGDTTATNYIGQRFTSAAAVSTSAAQAAAAQGNVGIVQGGGTVAAAAAASGEVIIPNYTGTTFHKEWKGTVASGLETAANQSFDAFGGMWIAAPAAITSIKLFSSLNNLAAGSSISLMYEPR